MSNKLYELRSRIREFENYIKNTPIEDEKDLEALNSIEQYHKKKKLSEDDMKIHANELYNHWMRIIDRRISRQKCDNLPVLEKEKEKELRNIFNNLQEKYKCYENVNDLYIKISSTCTSVMCKTKMPHFYGKYYPCKHFEGFEKERGRITKNSDDYTFKHYFDSEGKLVLTERIADYDPPENIYFFYYKNRIDAVWYNLGRRNKGVSRLDTAELEEGVIKQKIEGSFYDGKIHSFERCVYNYTSTDLILKEEFAYKDIDQEINYCSRTYRRDLKSDIVYSLPSK